MQKLSEKNLLARDAKRDLNAELLESINDLKAGKVGRVSVVTRTGQVIESPVAKARIATHMTQLQFATLMGVSVRTLQEWEQGRRSPSGAAKTLLKIAELNPKALIAVA
ncbi:COG2944 Predicted transcriptional regulator [Methylophilaceae bacterium]